MAAGTDVQADIIPAVRYENLQLQHQQKAGWWTLSTTPKWLKNLNGGAEEESAHSNCCLLVKVNSHGRFRDRSSTWGAFFGRPKWKGQSWLCGTRSSWITEARGDFLLLSVCVTAAFKIKVVYLQWSKQDEFSFCPGQIALTHWLNKPRFISLWVHPLWRKLCWWAVLPLPGICICAVAQQQSPTSMYTHNSVRAMKYIQIDVLCCFSKGWKRISLLPARPGRCVEVSPL